jgi:aquaglyceroporin related protein
MVTLLIGICTNIAVQTSVDTAGNYQSTNWAWGLGVMVGIYIAGGISGGHLNPAISLTLSLYRGFPIHKALVYILAQLIGAFLAGLIAYGVYRDAIVAFDTHGGQAAADGGSVQPQGLFAGGSGKAFFTQPADFAGVGTGFANEFVATAILACAVLALGDDSNAPPGAGVHALVIGLVVAALGMAFGYNTGACLNPARDFGPRTATAAVGYGPEVFTVRDAWWVYGAWGATISGALVGGLLYDVAIFVGGESPVNYPRSRRRRAKDKARRWWFGVKKETGKIFKNSLVKKG